MGGHARPDEVRPPIASSDALKFVRQDTPDGPGLVRCWLQTGPARKLPRIAGIPILIVPGEASYHAPYDHCTAKWLDQAGVKNTFVRLADRGIHGNGHIGVFSRQRSDGVEMPCAVEIRMGGIR